MTVIPHISFCLSSLYSAFHRVCPFLIAMWQSVPQSFSRSLFSSSTKYIRHVIKEQALFTLVYSLSPSSLTLTSSLSLSLLPFFPYPSPVPSPSGSNFSVSWQTSCCGPYAPQAKTPPCPPFTPLPLVSSPLWLPYAILLLKYFYERLNISTGKQDKNTDLRDIFAEQRVQRPWAVWFWRAPITRIQVLLGNRLSLYSFQPLLHSDTFSC